MSDKRATMPGSKGAPALDAAQIKKYEGLVRSIARKQLGKLPQHYELEELIADGWMGLMMAHDRFDPERGVKFETFATYYIRGAMLDNLPKLPKPPKIKGEKPAEAPEGAPAEGDDEGEAALMVNRVTELAYSYLLSLDDPAGGDGDDGYSRLDQLGRWDNKQKELEEQDLHRILKLTIQLLEDRERITLENYYFKNMSFAEIGEMLGLSESWVSRIHRRALSQVRQKLGKKKSIDDFISW
ncbi:MAG: sigma-70 family RNA polymerase sigma factor [Candidatus Sericytochromatia bacterium]|nr:sigma-70 family RNA polymerase sigma factor [Candidatus Sericytochromatia bacterium]